MMKKMNDTSHYSSEHLHNSHKLAIMDRDLCDDCPTSKKRGNRPMDVLRECA